MASEPYQFWLATFATEASSEDYFEACDAPLGSPREGSGRRIVAIDILMSGTEFVVAISPTTSLEPPTNLTCCVAFANFVRAGDLARQWGLPVVEAKIVYDPDQRIIQVIAPFFPPHSNVMRYESPLLEVGGVSFGYRRGKDAGTLLNIEYRQTIEAPDPAQPDTESTARRAALVPTFRTASVHQAPRKITLKVTPARVPDLTPLESTTYDAKIWSGSLSRVQRPLRTPVKRTPPETLPGIDAVARRAYRFEDVEVLGFRIDLRKFGEKDANRVLGSLIAPLNFHRRASAHADGRQRTVGLADFRYRAASHTLIVELLRYGKMKDRVRDRGRGRRRRRIVDGIRPDDYQSQHELLVRVLVGRLDDDTAQAHDAALFVPAIFVDNPWSKVLGREVQGFDKQLACFCARDVNGQLQPLRPDGRLLNPAKHDLPQPLVNLSQVRHVSQIGKTDGVSILDLDIDSDDLGDEDFMAINPKLMSGRSWLGGVRWRQSDFDAAEFRRSFARPVIADAISGTRSVQVSPVDNRGMDKTWIRGNFTVDSVRLNFPAGIATLALHAPETAPRSWRLLHELLGETVALPTGDWYRMQLSMDLTIDDGLRW